MTLFKKIALLIGLFLGIEAIFTILFLLNAFSLYVHAGVILVCDITAFVLIVLAIIKHKE